MSKRRKRDADIRVEDHGTVVLMRARSERGEAWMGEMIVTEAWQHFGGAIACEPRFVVDVIDGAEADGLVVEFGG